MDIKTIFKGAAAGAAAGMAYSVLSAAGPLDRMNLKKDAGKTIKAASGLISDLKQLIS
ncbi:hypothetical protein [Ruminococcus sp. XPD3002]|uniref:hypothetical protein n=1 Tax=Ruminococcus sp. XPD3002 TaxID=1452269 RepID=UPI0009203E02|nr:hypothetical protein [Ruminococcus sp.]SFX25932.1 hypothetical protein SAMN04487832_103174 [Ruminococcus flavefaciens]HPY84730.1 hypothetical protein [Ruminococcus flavefaciens]HRU96503.1 hypothetical protein [Ruminococcus sp.]